MKKKPAPEISLNWRNEYYGSVYAVAAFRNYNGASDWSDRQHQRFRGCLKRAGFVFHHGRCSYIAETGETEAVKLKLCDELAAAGFHILEGDARSPAAGES